MSEHKARRIAIKVLKIFGWIVGSIFGLLVLIALAIQIPWVQNKIKGEAISFLEGKIGTRVELEHFSLAFPKKIVITGLYLEDQQQDTLIYAGRLAIDTDLWALTDNTIELNTIELRDFTSKINRAEKDSAFNFDYITKVFASESEPVDTTTSSWKFTMGDIDLQNIRLSFDDKLAGNRFVGRLTEVAISMENFDLDSSRVHVDEIALIGITADVLQTKIPEVVPDTSKVVPADSAAIAFDIGFNKIRLENIDLRYHQEALGQIASALIPEATIEANAIDLKTQLIDLERISFRGVNLSYEQMPVNNGIPKVSNQSNVEKEESDAQPWNILLGAFELVNASIQYHDYNMPMVKNAMDFNHIWLSNFTSDIRNIRYTPEEIGARIAQLAFRERSGFRLASLRANMAAYPDSLGVDKLYIRTGNSVIQADAAATYASLETLADNYQNAKFALKVDPSTLSAADLIYFSPAALDSLPLKVDKKTTVRLDAQLGGTVNDLIISRLQLHMLNNTSLFASGHVVNVMDPDKMTFDVDLDRFSTGRVDLQAILADTLIPPSIEIPSWVSIEGRYKGSINTPQTKTTLTSEYGTVVLNAVADLRDGVKENYKADLSIQEFELGRLLKQPQQMGQLDMVAAVNGAGTSMENLDARLRVRVNKMVYSGYTYRDLRIDGTMKKYFFSGKALMDDDNLNFTLAADLDYNKEVPHYAVNFDLKNIDFKKLKLTPRPLRARAQLVVDLETPDFKSLNGDVGIRKVAVFNGEKLYAVDSLLFASIDQVGQSEIELRSDIMSGDFKGTINIFELPDLLTRHFNRYFSMKDTTLTEVTENQNFTFDLVIKNTDLITEILVPDLDPFVPGKIHGEFNSAEHRLNLDFGIAKVKYSSVALDSIGLKVISDPNSFDFTLGVHDILVDTLNIKVMRLAGNVMHDSIRTNFMILDSLGQEKYFLGGVFNSFEDAFQFRFLKNHIILNYEEWNAPLYNTLRFTPAGLDPNNFFIRKGGERILLLKKANRDSTLSVAFNKVDLANITSLVEGTTPLGGIIDGEVNLSSAKDGAFETELSISGLRILEQLWGDLQFAMNKAAQTPTNFKLDLKGEHALIDAGGYLTADNEPEISIEAFIRKLDLPVVEPLTMGQLKNLKGQLTGEFAMKGKTSDPDMSGSVTFRNTSLTSTFTNTDLAIEDETIFLRNDELVFDKFELQDSKKNKAVLDGLVTSNPGGGFDLKLNLNANNFQLINTTAKDNDLFYGKAWLNAKATITGNSNLPVIRMNVSLANQSEITYVVPQSEKGVMEQKGIVVFVDRDAEKDPFLSSINPKDTVQRGYTGMDLTANIELTDEEKFNVIIDPVSGDKLSVRGNTTLTLHMDPTGDMQLTGRYEITEGSYDLSFAKLVKRSFSIDKGSTILWTGDPLNGQMDIRAIYEVETSPVELVANQVSDEELNIYKKVVPFHVYLILKGELLFPDVSFRLDMPEEDRNEFNGNIYARLQDLNQQESDLNKQVFALLILKRFISDNPFDNRAGGSLASSARKSVSKLLSEQLNRLSSNVKGVELSFDVKSYDDYSQGNAEAQTELELGVSKSLMNDRLVVKVSGNVNIEGETQQQNSITDYIGDLALEYKLTKDGRLRVTGFRNSNYDLIDGDLIETGAGLIYIKDYDSFKELFKANQKQK